MNENNIVLVGNPNSGKTTLFNALTGSSQRVGNWPGVTVEKKEGNLILGDKELNIIDLPGAYTLASGDREGLDERIAINYIKNMTNGTLVNIIDATNLERHLYLTVQLIELGLPMIVVLTMFDKLPTNALDLELLEKLLGVPVVTVRAHQSKDLESLYKILNKAQTIPKKTVINYPQEMKFSEDKDILIADLRYGFVRDVCQKITREKTTTHSNISQTIDLITLNRWFGLPCFLLAMYLMFLFSINIGGVFQDFFDISSDTIFVGGSAYLLSAMHIPNVIIGILSYGLGKGINTVLTFVPVIASMFLFLSFLEGSGYMARAAFVVDRLMRSIGLPGKAFVPLIVGFGCNVPAIMATRTLESEKDRILASMMSPFMSCSARLAIFTVFVSVFFPRGGHNVVFALYLIGISIAVLTGYFLRNTVLSKDLTPLLMELPPYQMPNFKAIMRQTWGRLKNFLIRAGRVIVPVCTVLGALNVLNISVDGLVLDGNGDSVLAIMGKWLTPVFQPMGISIDNWPATVGLLMGTLAKEVVIATLNTLYSSVAGLQQVASESYQFWGGLQAAFATIPVKFAELGNALLNPVLASTPDQSMNKEVLGVLYKHFGGSVSAFSYLLFVLLYVPCVSTMAVIKKELNSFWMYFSIIWSTGIAYMTATVFYQLATINQHYLTTLIYLVVFMLMFFAMREIIKIYSGSILKYSETGFSK